jgi:hypothetical protein
MGSCDCHALTHTRRCSQCLSGRLAVMLVTFRSASRPRFMDDAPTAKVAAAPVATPSPAQRLMAAMEVALRPCGMLTDLSRIIAEYARPLPRWDPTCPHVTSDELSIEADGRSVRRSQSARGAMSGSRPTVRSATSQRPPQRARRLLRLPLPVSMRRTMDRCACGPFVSTVS